MPNFEIRSVGADRLSIILDDFELMLICNSVDRNHVRALAIQMHGDDCLCFWRDRGLDFLWVDAFRIGAAIDEYSGCTRDPNCLCSRKKSVGVRYHLIS